ncbi:hypothetical protein SLA2020_049930 [Shorea laevis]
MALHGRLLCPISAYETSSFVVIQNAALSQWKVGGGVEMIDDGLAAVTTITQKPLGEDFGMLRGSCLAMVREEAWDLMVERSVPV